MPLTENFHEVRRQWRAKKITLKETAKACNMAENTFIGKVKAFEKGTLR